jgi:hypothetical protein
MYLTVLLVHSWMRWVVILCALWAIGRALAGASSKRPWGPSDERAAKLFTITLDIQVLLGLILYFLLSPITRAAITDFGAAMKSSGMRFWSVEHVFGVVIGVLLAHRGRTRIKAVQDPVGKQRVAAVFFILSVLALLASVPWPGTPNARPLLRW